MNLYRVGNVVQLTGTFTDPSGDLVDPSTVVCKVSDPEGNATTPPVSRASVGIYTATMTIADDAAAAGVWVYRFEGTGTFVAAYEARFVVAPSPFYPT